MAKNHYLMIENHFRGIHYVVVTAIYQEAKENEFKSHRTTYFYAQSMQMENNLEKTVTQTWLPLLLLKSVPNKRMNLFTAERAFSNY